MVCVFHIFTGDAVIQFILPTLLKELVENYRLGMVVTRFFGLLALVGSVYTVKTFGRRTLLLWGHSIIAVELVVIGLC